MLGFFDPDYFFDPFFADKIELLPNGDILEQSEISNYKTVEFFHYFELWENFHYFGLPHGKGWIEEKPFVIQILKAFQKCFDLYEIKQIQKK